MAEKMTKILRLEGVKVIFKNFKGEEKKYNRAGARNFCVSLNEEQGEKLEKEGWYVTWKEDSDGERTAKIKISISYKLDNLKPHIVMVVGKKNTELDEEAIEALDSAEIESADIIARPYNWEVNGKTGVSAYLKDGYFNVIEDEFYSKYYDQEPDDVPF